MLIEIKKKKHSLKEQCPVFQVFDFTVAESSVYSV